MINVVKKIKQYTIYKIINFIEKMLLPQKVFEARAILYKYTVRLQTELPRPSVLAITVYFSLVIECDSNL